MTEFNQTLAPLLLLVIGVPLVLVWVGSRSMIRARSTVTRVFAGVVAACSVAVLSLVGWWLVLGSYVIQVLNGALLFHAFSAYILPLQAEFGWSRAAVSGGRRAWCEDRTEVVRVD